MVYLLASQRINEEILVESGHNYEQDKKIMRDSRMTWASVISFENEVSDGVGYVQDRHARKCKQGLWQRHLSSHCYWIQKAELKKGTYAKMRVPRDVSSYLCFFKIFRP
ncbi:hypothetical protein VNO77_17331 [Canavalia gladiata]|uniref:Uncharacterized protein n=1 Tax=Canavalia gladiata TaxID=3824 RepID=A0AAN9QML7_CANGL